MWDWCNCIKGHTFAESVYNLARHDQQEMPSHHVEDEVQDLLCTTGLPDSRASSSGSLRAELPRERCPAGTCAHPGALICFPEAERGDVTGALSVSVLKEALLRGQHRAKACRGGACRQSTLMDALTLWTAAQCGPFASFANPEDIVEAALPTRKGVLARLPECAVPSSTSEVRSSFHGHDMEDPSWMLQWL
jgi:hypothetical protein